MIATKSYLKGLPRLFFWAIFSGTTFLVSLHLAWLILAKVDFFYPVCHDLLKIDRVVAHYGPQNRVRKNFELTSREERIRLFEAINRAAHQGGKTLEIHYYAADGSDLGPMLTLWDQAHLSQVALLLSRLRILGWVWMTLWIFLLFGVVKYRQRPPPLRNLIQGTVVVLSGLVGLIFLAGPGRLFSGLHRMIFPATQPWFLYYQESLMTLLMKAPDLFGLIALQIFVVGLLSWLGLLIAAYRFFLLTAPRSNG